MYTPEDLLIEYWEDYFEKHPNAVLHDNEAEKEAADILEEVSQAAGGDPLAAEIEKRLAKGASIDDLLDILDPTPDTDEKTETYDNVKGDGSFFEGKVPTP